MNFLVKLEGNRLLRIRHIEINNFRGIKHAELTFPSTQRLICLIEPKKLLSHVLEYRIVV